ncbi:putative zinc finger matrin-type protein 2 [Paratrimastix pyriformis]|uniref:Zinc finger matrin-type protein 2 n=1 Tax=Paratrimastix pyriformis TaxID=342808 RepID=A0ABQ8URH4_9EUKA|nr:putative zinc finger matrin-type protein 2 [Paratrimastix pyriformis]
MSDRRGQGVDQIGRRTWDVAKYEKLAAERTARESQEMEEKSLGKHGRTPLKDIKPRETLRPRDFRVDIAQNLGKTKLVTSSTALPDSGGFWCEVCECLIKDSANWLDHLNGKKHQRALGMSMRVTRSSLEDVKARLAAGRNRQAETDGMDPEHRHDKTDLDQKLDILRDHEERLREARRVDEAAGEEKGQPGGAAGRRAEGRDEEAANREADDATATKRSRGAPEDEAAAEPKTQAVGYCCPGNPTASSSPSRRVSCWAGHGQQPNPEEDMMAAMGLPAGFGSSKK